MYMMKNIVSQKVFESLGYRKYVNEDNCIVEYRKCSSEHGGEKHVYLQ